MSTFVIIIIIIIVILVIVAAAVALQVLRTPTAVIAPLNSTTPILPPVSNMPQFQPPPPTVGSPSFNPPSSPNIIPPAGSGAFPLSYGMPLRINNPASGGSVTTCTIGANQIPTVNQSAASALLWTIESATGKTGPIQLGDNVGIKLLSSGQFITMSNISNSPGFTLVLTPTLTLAFAQWTIVPAVAAGAGNQVLPGMQIVFRNVGIFAIMAVSPNFDTICGNQLIGVTPISATRAGVTTINNIFTLSGS